MAAVLKTPLSNARATRSPALKIKIKTKDTGKPSSDCDDVRRIKLLLAELMAADPTGIKLSELDSIAERLNSPLWVLLIPGLHDHPELLENEGLKRLRQLVENYLASNQRDRRGMDVFAAHCALNA